MIQVCVCVFPPCVRFMYLYMYVISEFNSEIEGSHAFLYSDVTSVFYVVSYVFWSSLYATFIKYLRMSTCIMMCAKMVYAPIAL